MRVFLWIVMLVVAAQAVVVYETGFEAYPDLPPGWAIESYGPGPDWGFGGNPQDWHMRVRFGDGGDQDEWLISPVFDLSGSQGVSVQFWQWFRTLGNGVGQLRVSTDGGATWVTVIEYGTDQAGEPEVAVPQANGHANVRFCWRYLASNDYQWDVDDVRIHAQVPVDMTILGARGPSSGDYVRQGADLVARLVLRNLGNQSSPAATLRFTTGQGGSQASIPSGIAPGDSLAVSFTVPGSLFSAVGDHGLIAVVSAPGDAVGTNDTLEIAPLHVIDWFPSPATTLLNFTDPADSALFASVLEARGEQYDSWNRLIDGAFANLYGLDAWRVVCFAEAGAYPALSAQFAMMRFLDQPAPGLRRGLLMAGDEWVHLTETGAVVPEFMDYLGMVSGGQITADMPTLFPVPGNALGFSQAMATNAVLPDVLAPNPTMPNASLVLTYDEAHNFGAMGTYRTPSYQTIAAGFEFGQLIVYDEQVLAAGACVDWMLAAKAQSSVGDALRLGIAPNPASGRLFLRVPEAVCAEGAQVSLVDMAGRRSAAWRLKDRGAAELRLPDNVRAGAYCLVVSPRAGGHLTESVVVWP
ncbi:choice-of-anchor J domain-containing protein [Candidatus Fermentibacteria bacterium]|nr:choice-of-anchor J domain-containing protein [Candidatus Fermentibacteria bacterium]